VPAATITRKRRVTAMTDLNGDPISKNTPAHLIEPRESKVRAVPQSVPHKTYAFTTVGCPAVNDPYVKRAARAMAQHIASHTMLKDGLPLFVLRHIKVASKALNENHRQVIECRAIMRHVMDETTRINSRMRPSEMMIIFFMERWELAAYYAER
jgi:hypothetical protein